MDQKYLPINISLGFHFSRLEFSTHVKAVPNELCIWGEAGGGTQGLTHGKQTSSLQAQGGIISTWNPEVVAMDFPEQNPSAGYPGALST